MRGWTLGAWVACTLLAAVCLLAPVVAIAMVWP